MNIADIGNEIKESFQPDKNSDHQYLALEHVDPDALHINGFGSSSEVESNKYFFKKGDILFGTLRPYFRKLVIAPFDGVCSTEFSVIRPVRSEDKQFLFYSLANPKFIEFATTNSNGARPRTKWKLFSKFAVAEHDDISRESIGEKLACFDSLIENNRRRIELLEDSAKQLYKEWFVRFRFPGHEHIKSIGGVPEGWDRIPLTNFLDIKHGFAFKGEFFSEEPTPLILMSPGNFKIGGGIKLDKKKYYAEGSPIPEDYVLEESDLLVTMTDLSKTSDTLGYPALVPKPIGQVYLHNQRLGKVTSNTEGFFPKYFFYHILLDNNYRSSIVGSASGTSVKHTSPTKILSYKQLMPVDISSSLIKQFDVFAEDIYDQINVLIAWNENLTKARESLLPKLMSGEVAV
tara:strand:- start:12250 stop:13458 length:1209 start_codon:yes stop_codon:yes gene_type:complete